MDEKLVDLKINKLIQEYSFLKSDEELKKELINTKQKEFLDLVNGKLNELNPQDSNHEPKTKQEPKSKKIEPKIDISGMSENTKVRIKKIYRNIVKVTHPDRIDSEELKELYMEATEAYEAYNIFELCFISKKLNIKVKLSLEETKTLNELINSKKDEIKKIESSFIWLWLIAPSENEKNELVDRFIEKHYK
jgi:pyruvate/2-oxoglutarate dehydrogenase complex dihydrolipoamide acyltransferase (E2) component